MRIEQRIPDWSVGAVVTLLFFVIIFTGFLDFTNAIELKTFDFRARMAAPEERNPDIELVVITDDDLAEYGRFPWPRNILAEGIEVLAESGAKVIALNILFTEPEESAQLLTLKRLKESYEAAGLAQQGAGLAFYKGLSQSLADLDNDRKLHKALEKAGNVVLPVYFDTQSRGRDREVPDFVTRNAFKSIRGADQDWAVQSVIWLSKLKPLLPIFAETAEGVGHINLFPDRDGLIRHQAPVVGYLKDIYFPSLPMAIVKAYKGLKDRDMSVVLGEGIDLRVSPASVVQVPATDTQMLTLIRWHQGPGVAFHRTPFAKVHKKQIQPRVFKDKIVIIGATAPGIGNRFVTPISGNLPGVEVVANSVANILSQDFFARPEWVGLTELAVLILFGLFLTFGLPRLSAGLGALTALLLLAGYGGFGTFLFFSSKIWLRVAPPILLLLVGYILIMSKRFLITERRKEQVEADSVETNKMLGISFQQQGMLDLAFEKFRRLPLGEEGVKDLIYNLGLDYERKRQFAKALSVYNLIASDGKPFKDLGERIPKLKGAEATLVFGAASSSHPGDIGATIEGMETKPTLGRYEVVGELGRGAMGVVYKGEDPKIHRTVAIKTVSLSQFDEEALPEVKDRFFREAEAAGVLTHPKIVTVYDCGEEHDLAYIAMEFMDGEDLEPYTTPGNLLPIRETLEIVASVAEALDYAHGKNIVHRDIKPANVMRLKETREVKVTDFGVARITSSSQTKTGVVLGTPSYMSPEQVSGKRVDGRSDIFSLGVVLYELLTGKKPFLGEDITSLMFNIAKEKHVSPRSINPKIPPIIEKIIDKALEKNLDKRYQKAGQMASHLKQVIAKIDQIAAKRRAQAKPT